jgi:hypothetical protein
MLFVKKYCKNLTVTKSSQKMQAISVVSIKVPKVTNHALGKNSPNLVTLKMCFVVWTTLESSTYIFSLATLFEATQAPS